VESPRILRRFLSVDSAHAGARSVALGAAASTGVDHRSGRDLDVARAVGSMTHQAPHQHQSGPPLCGIIRGNGYRVPGAGPWEGLAPGHGEPGLELASHMSSIDLNRGSIHPSPGRCPRCGGSVIRHYDVVSCLACGWEPPLKMTDFDKMRLRVEAIADRRLRARHYGKYKTKRFEV